VIAPSVHEAFRVLGKVPRLGLGLRPGKYVLVVGQSAPYKNHEMVVRAFAAAFCDTPDMRLVIVHRLGGGARIGDLASQLGIRDRVTILGRVTEPALVALYNGAIALCHPSLCEGLGIPILEAMACGCPVITSRASAMPETAGGAAVLTGPDKPCEIAAALRRVADDPRLAAALRTRGLQRARALPSWDDFAREHVVLYRRLIGADDADAPDRASSSNLAATRLR
jgi:glycosyltransferase involved in cell wall biosynthesis